MQPDEATQDKTEEGSLIEEDATATPAAAEEESDEAGMPGMDSEDKEEDDEMPDGAPETAPADETTPAL